MSLAFASGDLVMIPGDDRARLVVGTLVGFDAQGFALVEVDGAEHRVPIANVRPAPRRVSRPAP